MDLSSYACVELWGVTVRDALRRLFPEVTCEVDPVVIAEGARGRAHKEVVDGIGPAKDTGAAHARLGAA